MKMYLVGGAVRDALLNIPSNDFDYTVVLGPDDMRDRGRMVFEDPFAVMRHNLINQGFEIFLETPEYLTIRARFPKGHVNSGTTADFVLARKESGYEDGRRPDRVVPGNLYDDLTRRDLTMNAIAQDMHGNLIDLYNGQKDIDERILRAVGIPFERLTEDALRAVRVLRFAVTKGFSVETSLAEAMESQEVLDSIQDTISDERIQVEISKMFRHSTPRSLDMLYQFPYLSDAIFSGRVSLDATMKTKGRGIK